MQFVYNDGGRSAAGYKGRSRDCVCRSIAIATGMDYQEVYDLIKNTAQSFERGKRKSNPNTGVYKKTIKRVLDKLGWKWIPTMFIGSGCKVHLSENELPKNKTLIVSVSKHITCVIDGVIQDTHDCSRDENRCVYGYWVKE